MKKLLAVVLAAVLALSLGVVSFAADKVADADTVVATYTWYDTNDDPIADLKDLKLTNVAFDRIDDTTDLVQPDSTVWVSLGAEDFFTNKDLFKVKPDKGDNNAKLISKVSVATSDRDKFSGDLGRKDAIKIEVKPDYTDNDYKFTPSVKFTAKDAIKVNDTDYPEGTYCIVDIVFWSGNLSQDADRDYAAGDGGVVLKPAKNDDNEITWEDENNTIATLKFAGDDNQTKFFPKLSTKWEDADYAEYFADQDAFIFNFVASAAGKTKISSTSRATLELYNPYYDSEEDELTVEPENVVIYMVGDDGSINDVTASFKAVETDDGDYVFQTKTRELGVYIIAEKPYTTAAAEDVETPDDGKAIPDTGIWA